MSADLAGYKRALAAFSEVTPEEAARAGRRLAKALAPAERLARAAMPRPRCRVGGGIVLGSALRGFEP